MYENKSVVTKSFQEKNQIHENIAYEVIDSRVQIWDEIKICDNNGCMKNKKEAKNGDLKERLK